MRRAGIEATDENLAFWNSLPAKTHNLVWTHQSGRKSLVIGCHASHVEGIDKTEGQKLPNVDGFTPDQRYFIGMAQWACENNRPENERVNAVTNPLR